MELLNDEIKIYEINMTYRQYLYNFDDRVNLKRGRRFIGIILTNENYKYFLPLTSRPLRNNGKRRNKRTTIEIFNESRELVAALLINNMIPVPEDCYYLIDINNDRDKDYLNSEYIYLRKESTKHEILRKVDIVYTSVINKSDSFLLNFCCDYKLLESKMKLYHS